MVNPVEISNGSILLRPYKLSDVDSLHQAASESTAEVWQWLEWCHPGLTADECRRFIERQSDNWAKGIAYNFAITELQSDFYLGGCGLTEMRHEDRVASVVYWVRTGRTGEGIATATVLLLAGFGFRQLRLNRIEIVIATGNLASQRVAKKTGTVREGILRDRYEAHGRIQDAFMFSLIPQDLSQKK